MTLSPSVVMVTGTSLKYSFSFSVEEASIFAMGVDHDLVVVAGCDVDGAEVDVDDQFAARFGGARFVNVFFGRRERGDGGETNEYQGCE